MSPRMSRYPSVCSASPSIQYTVRLNVVYAFTYPPRSWIVIVHRHLPADHVLLLLQFAGIDLRMPHHVPQDVQVPLRVLRQPIDPIHRPIKRRVRIHIPAQVLDRHCPSPSPGGSRPAPSPVRRHRSSNAAPCPPGCPGTPPCAPPAHRSNTPSD